MSIGLTFKCAYTDGGSARATMKIVSESILGGLDCRSLCRG